MQDSSEYPDHLSVLSRALWCFFPITFLEIAVNSHKYNIKSTYEPSGLSISLAYPGFRSMKRLGVFLLPPGWDASPSQGYPQQ